MTNNAKRKYRNHCPLPNARFTRSTGGGFGAGAATIAGGDCYRLCIPYDNKGAWELFGGWVGNDEREVQKARKHGEPAVLRAGGGICSGGSRTPRV